MALSEITPELLQRIAAHQMAAAERVADVSDDWEAARAVADGRAPHLPEYNHVGLLRARPDGAEKLLDKAERFFAKRNRPASVVLDPLSTPEDLPQRLEARGFSRDGAPRNLMLWDPDSRHIYTAPEVYMTLATNATLDDWLRIATGEMDPERAGQARGMRALEFRTAGFTFWFGLFDGVPAGTCPLYVADGYACVGPVRVDPDFRNKGVGLALVNYVTRQSRKDGARETYLYNDPDGPATGLCRTVGYRTVSEDAQPIWRKETG